MQIFAGWVITIVFACGICALFVALGVNSPNRRQTDDVITAQNVSHSVKMLYVGSFCLV